MEKYYYRNLEGRILEEAIKNKEYKILNVLKEDRRSKVYLIEVSGKKYVYKIPVEKNTRKWQRILSIFRGGESKREFKSLDRVLKNGFNGPEPLLYWEKRKWLMVTDSYIISRFIKGCPGEKKDVKIIGKVLADIHGKGFLHGDSQLPNFMIDGKKIYLIDAKLMRNVYGGFGRAYEFIYLEESYHDILDIYDKESFYYKIAKMLNTYLHKYGDFRKKIKSIFRGKDK
ncbi:MAG: lipopolysaccharide biosynthesis protein [Cetobacterium sp.]|nr:lipopolysaccharide biosynthesis protein [Cetobacterium sp.]